jgi:hypothetical protein
MDGFPDHRINWTLLFWYEVCVKAVFVGLLYCGDTSLRCGAHCPISLCKVHTPRSFHGVVLTQPTRPGRFTFMCSARRSFYRTPGYYCHRMCNRRREKALSTFIVNVGMHARTFLPGTLMGFVVCFQSPKQVRGWLFIRRSFQRTLTNPPRSRWRSEMTWFFNLQLLVPIKVFPFVIKETN